MRYTINEEWQAPVIVYSTLVPSEPKIVVINGRLYIVWLVGWKGWGRDIFFCSSIDGVLWSKPTNLTNEWKENIGKTSPIVIVDSKNNFHL